MPGQIELMQNRRLLDDDGRGVEEALDEVDEDGYGMAVTATYYLQLFNYNTTKSAQRKVQQAVDEPLQYFFSMNQVFPRSMYTQQASYDQDPISQTTSGTYKYHTYPLSKNSILLRIENIGDIFDGSIDSQTDYIDIK